MPSDERGLEAVGGLEDLKEWLRIRGRAFEPAARDFGLEPPRGVLLTGVPGCGKSLVAKTLARAWNLALVLLDPGRLYGPYVGESETRLDTSLATVEAMAPSVLWVDEIEKGSRPGRPGAIPACPSACSARSFGGCRTGRPACSSSRPATTSRCCHPSSCDAVGSTRSFFVDLPRPDERAAILRIQLQRRGRDPSAFDVEPLAAASDGFSGAELEGAIVSAMYRVYADGRELSTEAVAAELRATVPLSRTRAESILELRAWADGRAIPASA